MTSFVSYKNLYELNKLTKAPIYIYMMDMAPMTGGCHYAWDCKGYLFECGKCPAFYSESENDQSKENLRFKKTYVEKTNFSVITASEWQYRQLLKCSLFANNLKYKILLSIDHELFKPIDKEIARKELKLPIDKKIIFFGAVSVYEKRKGFNELKLALQTLNFIVEEPNQIHLAIAGNSRDIILNEIPFEYTLLGYLDYSTLAKALGAADVFVNPCIEDSGPMMINQSIMCGTPVVAFEMGVALDLIINGKTGYKAKLGNSVDLANALNKILMLDPGEYNKISENCREKALSSFSNKTQTSL